MSGHLQAEITQPTAFRSREAEVFLNVRRTSSSMMGDLVELLRPHEHVRQPGHLSGDELKVSSDLLVRARTRPGA